ncbi:MAG: FAD-dependent oxidoreductase, partial [Actinobacteria bacterium]|nr:FAD-dependent oxidoreductase [Actinomycetota bacterium]MBT7379434.1 FAD-dependent oxidoreductase [Actinomycetota bacterium]MBT7869214.1 FAD-dependent oxidoreductase [Actinomycetota bacterium]
MIIGGGITGAGVARAASQRGLSVALLEAKDFSSGTSSKSSKLIHGGLRYLAMGHFRVVRHTARERAVVHALAPHLCEPHWMVFPVASRRWLVLMDVVVRIYEMLGGVKRSDRHRRWGRAEVAQNEPALRAEKSRYAVTFREYLTDDCRLVLANLRDAVASGAQVANYLSVDGLLGENQAEGVTAQCALTGRSIQVKAAVVVNATGPWVDATRQLEADVEPRLVLSRGIHVAVRRTDLPVNNLVTMTGSDGRPVFALPRGPVTYLGTTDTRHLEPATHHPSVEQIDVDFLLTTVEDHFDISLTPKQVTGAWAGLRPLISKP